jgi:hypothetical protein
MKPMRWRRREGMEVDAEAEDGEEGVLIGAAEGGRRW